MKKRLVVIGNGFDLGHGLKTNFNDFIETNKQALENKYKAMKNGGNGWAEIEQNFKKILNERMERVIIPFFVDEALIDIIDNYGVNKYGDVNYYNYENQMFNSIIAEIDSWVGLFCEFEKEFLVYLKTRYSDENIRKILSIKAKIQAILNCANNVLSFNYTNVVEEIYGVKKVLHIHGNINNEIFLGCDTIDKLKDVFVTGEYHTMGSFEKSKYGLQEMMRYYEEDEDHELHPKETYVQFFKEIMERTQDSEIKLRELLQRKSKDSLLCRQKTIETLKKAHYDEVIIIGHSLSEVDESVFYALNKDAKFICYYHDDEDLRIKQKAIQKFEWHCDLLPSEELYA